MFAGTSVALFHIVLRMDGLRDFDQEMRHAIQVRIGRARVPVLSLSRIIDSKKAANRQKDRLVLPVLEDAMTTLTERTRRRSRGRGKGRSRG
jgi:hypothetical protein